MSLSFGKAVIALHEKNMRCGMDDLDKKINELLQARIALLTQQLEDEKGVLDKIGDLFGCATSRRSSECSRELLKYTKILDDRRNEYEETMRNISNELQLQDACSKGGAKTVNPRTKKYNKSNKRICRRTRTRTRTRTRARTRTRTRTRTRPLIRF